MDTVLRRLLILLLWAVPTLAQCNLMLLQVGGCPIAGTSVTVNLGGVQVNTLTPDTGNANEEFATPFITPASMTSPSFGNIGVYWFTADGANPDTGVAIYADVATTGTVNTQNASSGSCTANCVLLQSGSNFNTTAWKAPQIININGVLFHISSTLSTTLIQLNDAPGTQTGVTYTVHSPGAILTDGVGNCSTTSTSAVTSNSYNIYTPTHCPAPSTNTIYWVVSITQSNTQGTGRIEGNMPCPLIGNSWGNQLAGFGSFPVTNFGSGGGGGATAGDGCVATYATINYTTTAPFTLITSSIGFCDAGGTTCDNIFPATQSGDGLLVWEVTSNSGAPVKTPSDAASDTFTAIGSCPVTVTGVNYSTCLYFTPRVTAGTKKITCNFTALNKDYCGAIEIQGTPSSSVVDQSCFDTTTTSSTPFNVCSTSTTAQASELWISTVFNADLFTIGTGNNIPSFTAGGSWTLLGSAQAGGTGGGTSYGFFGQTTTGTGTCDSTGSTLSNGSNLIFTSCVTLK